LSGGEEETTGTKKKKQARRWKTDYIEEIK
jgi:hypothetical protein